MDEKLVIVFVRGGVVDDVYISPPGGSYKVVDFDSLESGVCPYCGEQSIEVRGGKPEWKTVMVNETRTWIDESGAYPIPVTELTGRQVPARAQYTIGGYPYCPTCDINWSDVSDEEIIARGQREP